MLFSKNKRFVEINKEIENINSIKDVNERLEGCNKLFESVLKESNLYVVAVNNTTEEEWKSNKFRAYVDEIGQGDSYYLRVFTEAELAKNCAKRINSVCKDGSEMFSEISNEQLTSLVRDLYVMGLDGIILNEGENWITLNCEAFLYIAMCNVLNIPEHYNKDFVNMVKVIYDIAKKRVRVVAPYKYYDGICEDDIINGKGELYPFGDEVLFLEYYDKYKVEKIFKEKVYWYDLNIIKFYSSIETAKEANIRNIKIAYRNKEANGSPKEIIELLKVVGFTGYKN
ncbi:MAG: hypothetical protein GX275_10155 [Clostridiales bacterium]|mgnify:CR=1 FL=1|nr:hypothetical protein [Clostridiales bacterium]